MSITAPPNGGRTLLPSEQFPPIIWSVRFTDGLTVESGGVSWADFSELVTIDGVSLHLSRQPIQSIVVSRGKQISALDIEEPACCFGFHRWRSSPLCEQEWLYSAFGFFQEHARVILQVREVASRVVLQKRSTPFVL